MVFDATELRLQNNKSKTLHLNSASKGSLILAGLAFGLSVWILNQTLGETVKEAWTESERHEKLKSFLKSNLCSRSEIIKKNISNELSRKGIFPGIEVKHDNEDVELRISVDAKEEKES